MAKRVKQKEKRVDRKALKLWVPVDTYKRVEDAAEREGRSVSNWGRRIVEEALEKTA